jgi:hypothetical protein
MTDLKKIVTNKAEAGIAIAEMRDFDRPDLMKIPKKNPKFQYRWIRNVPDNIAEWEARGYTIANSDQVRECGKKTSLNGACIVGDLILAVTPWEQFEERREKKALLARRQEELNKRGTKREIKAGTYAGHPSTFTETVREG